MALTPLVELSEDDIRFELGRGSRFVVFEYCVSILIMTFKLPTEIYLVRPDERVVGKALSLSLLTLLAGWWGVPWGPVYTVVALVRNLTGGRDVTEQVALQMTAADDFDRQVADALAKAGPEHGFSSAELKDWILDDARRRLVQRGLLGASSQEHWTLFTGDTVDGEAVFALAASRDERFSLLIGRGPANVLDTFANQFTGNPGEALAELERLCGSTAAQMHLHPEQLQHWLS